jgi:hypothetical protein
VPRHGQSANDGVPELDDVAVSERLVWEGNAGLGRKVRGRARRLDERREAGNVIRLDVRLEHGRDRRAHALGRLHVLLDELDVRIDDREPRVRQAAEQIARAGSVLVEEGPQDHCFSLGCTLSSR